MPPTGASGVHQLSEIKKECRNLRLAAAERTLAASESAEVDRDMGKLNGTLEDVARRIAAEETRASEVKQAVEEKEMAVPSPSKMRLEDPATLRRTVDQLKRRQAVLAMALTKYADHKLGQREEEALAATLLEITELEKEKSLAESNLRKLVHQVNQRQRVAETADHSQDKQSERVKTQEAYVKRLETVLEKTKRNKAASVERAAALELEWTRWLELLQGVATRVRTSGGKESELVKRLEQHAESPAAPVPKLRSPIRVKSDDEAVLPAPASFVIDSLRSSERMHSELKKRGNEVVKEERELQEKLETMKARILAQREKLASAIVVPATV